MVSLRKESIFTAIVLLFCTIILVSTVRGLPGNPTDKELNTPYWLGNGPFETSNDRGRYALIYSLVENRSLLLSYPLAEFSTPDLAVNKDGRYVSLFAPGVALIMMPSYSIGKLVGMSQMGVFLTMSFFALLNIILLRSIAIRLGASPLASTLGALTFIFATPAFAYATTLYQHHISTFIILTGLYILIRWNNWWSLAAIWFLYALSGIVDNPNYLIMFPIALGAAARTITVVQGSKTISVKLKMAGVLTLATALIPGLIFIWYNQNANGAPLLISGSLKRVLTVDKAEISSMPNLEAKLEVASNSNNNLEDKNPVGFFKTRNLLNGFYIHFLSPDRGMIHYTPILVLGIAGIYYMYRRKYEVANLVVAIVGITVLLYSMWGDPYGGWSFGSRYLVPAYAFLSMSISFALTELKKNYFFLAIFSLIFVYSAQINTLGAITTTANPPQVEILALEKISGVEQKYTEERNWQYLKETGSKSFLYQTVLKGRMPAEEYYWIIFYSIVTVTLVTVLSLRFWESSVATENSKHVFKSLASNTYGTV